LELGRKGENANTDLMPRSINVINAEVMKQQRSCIWAEQQTLETRHICKRPKSSSENNRQESRNAFIFTFILKISETKNKEI